MQGARLFFLTLCLLPAATLAGADRRPLSRFVVVEPAVRIHYLEHRPAGSDKNPTLVFVPGWMLPGEVWARQLSHFGNRYRTLAIDPRSQGDSSKVADGNYPAARARDLRALITKLGLERVILVGASSGVTDVAAYVDTFGTSGIEALVLVHGVPGADYDAGNAPGLLGWAQRFQTDRRTQTEALVRSLFKRPQDPVYLKHLTERAMMMPTNSAIAAFFGSFTSDYRPALSKIDKPTLIITARNAWMNHYEAMQQRIPGSRMEVVENVGHAPYLEDPSTFNGHVERFLEEKRRVP